MTIGTDEHQYNQSFLPGLLTIDDGNIVTSLKIPMVNSHGSKLRQNAYYFVHKLIHNFESYRIIWWR